MPSFLQDIWKQAKSLTQLPGQLSRTRKSKRDLARMKFPGETAFTGGINLPGAPTQSQLGETAFQDILKKSAETAQLQKFNISPQGLADVRAGLGVGGFDALPTGQQDDFSSLSVDEGVTQPIGGGVTEDVTETVTEEVGAGLPTGAPSRLPAGLPGGLPGGVTPGPFATTPGLTEVGGVGEDQISYLRKILGLERTPEEMQQIEQSQQILQQLLPFRQALIQAQAPSEAITQLDAQIGELERQIKRTTPQALVGRAETLRGAELEARARRAPVQTELTELLFKRSALGQKRLQEVQQAQAGIQALGAEFDIRQALGELTAQPALPAGIQTKLFERLLPEAPGDKVLLDISKTFNVPYGTTPQQAAEQGLIPGTDIDKLLSRQLKQAQITTLNLDLGRAMDNNLLSKEQLAAATSIGRAVTGSEIYRDMTDMNTGIIGVHAGTARDTGFGDIAAINAFQRMIDPGATVREGDVALIKTAIAFLAKIDPKFMIARLKKGDVLPPETRKEMRELARDLYEQQRKSYNELAGKTYKARARAAGIPYKFVAQDFLSADEVLETGTIEIEEGSDISDLDFSI